MIDFHTHIYPEKIIERTLKKLADTCNNRPVTNGMADGLLRSMEEAGVDLSVILPVVTNPSQFRTVNQFAAQFRGDRLLSFGGIHPDSGDYKSELNELKKMGFLGIKLHPDYQGVFIDDIRYKRIISYATELEMIVVAHAGVDSISPKCVHCSPRKALDMIRDVKPEKLVLAHLGGYRMWDEVEEYLVGLPIWLDTAVPFGELREEQFVRIIRAHGADRILFATDSPWVTQKEMVEKVERLPITDEERKRIANDNAKELLGIEVS